MSLMNENYAIICNDNWGPVFGKYFLSLFSCDIGIYDRYDLNSNSQAYLPYYYKGKSNYQNNQEMWTKFCGSADNCNFRVTEYEVFQVFW